MLNAVNVITCEWIHLGHLTHPRYSNAYYRAMLRTCKNQDDVVPMPLFASLPPDCSIIRAKKWRIKKSTGLKVFHIFAGEPRAQRAGGNVVRVVTEMYSADIRNDVVQARKRARRSATRARRKPYPSHIAAEQTVHLFAKSVLFSVSTLRRGITR